jgi:hypothetical protein
VHGDADADGALSETLQRAAEIEGAVTLSFTTVVLPSLAAELRTEGEQLWLDEYTWPPAGWADEDFIRYALARRLRGPA